MSIDYTPEDANRYACEIIEDARLHPSIGIGMPVDVYDNENLYEWIGEGVIVSMFWSNYYYQYICDVRGVDCVWPCVMAGRIEPQRMLRGSWVVGVVSC